MRDYEILFIVRPELDEEQVQSAAGDVTRLIETLGGEAQRTNVWGKRRLAYEVDHVREGHYVLTDFRLDAERVPELEATLQISETVFRHLVVRKPQLKAPRPSGRAARGAPDTASDGAAAEAPAASTEPAQPAATAEPAAPAASGAAEEPAAATEVSE